MTRAYRKYLRWQGSMPPRWLHNGARQHVREFGRCIGIVEGYVKYDLPEGEPQFYGPEVNVRWQPSNLRYGYLPKYLEVVR